MVMEALYALAGAWVGKSPPPPVTNNIHVSPVFNTPTTPPPVVNNLIQPTQSSGVLGTIAQCGAIMAGVGASLYSYNNYDAWHDEALLNALRKEDCGGLSKMTNDVEACYRKYLSKAIHRTASGPEYSNYLNRFDSCFYERPQNDCSWEGWWNSDKIFEAGKDLKVDKQYISRKV